MMRRGTAASLRYRAASPRSARLPAGLYLYTDTDKRGDASMAVEKVTFTLPEELVRRLARIPAGMRSKLVKEAVERELKRQSAVAELKKLRGKLIWKEKHHADLRTSKDFARYRPAKSRLTG